MDERQYLQDLGIKPDQNIQIRTWENGTQLHSLARLIKNYHTNQLKLHVVIQAKPEKANAEVLAIMATLIRTLSRLENNNPNLLLDVDKKRLLKGKETLTEWCKTDLKDILKPSSL